jgi:hypothetical protein
MPGEHGGGCNCQEELGQELAGNEWLDKYIDKSNIESFGTAESSAHPSLVFRPFSERIREDQFIISDMSEPNEFDDEETGIVISIPFTCPVKLTGITVIGGENGRSPTKVDLLANCSDLATARELAPTQTIDNLVEDFCGAVEHPLRVARFPNVTSLILRFPEPEKTVFWIGLRGVASGAQRKAVVTVYESRANLADHKVKENPFAQSRQIQ